MSFIAVFPGQGSQALGMLAEYADNNVVAQTFAEASEALGLDLWALCQQDEAKLNQTEFTQPVLLTASVALYRLWREKGGAKPMLMAGHSLGEYSALASAGALELGTAVRLVNARGKAMQSAVPAGVGAMAAVIGLDDAGVQGLCDAVAESEILAPVNYNSPGQVVIAGHKAAVDRAVAAGKEHGARMVKPLAVSVPSHCALMKDAAAAFAEILAEVTWQSPQVPVIQNVSALPASDIAGIEAALLQQLYSPVRWVQSMEYALAQAANYAVEFGPGAVLQGLNKRINKGWPQYGTAKPEQLAVALEA